VIGRVLLLTGTAVAVVVVALVAVVAALVSGGPSGGRVSGTAVADIPAPMLALYQRAATSCPGLDWAVLVAVGKVETDHGRSPLPGVRSGENPAGAGVISGSAQAPRHVRLAADTPRAGEVSAGVQVMSRYVHDRTGHRC
jgi:hypothetical protein